MNEKDLDESVNYLLKEVKSYNPNANLKIIEKAVRFSAKIHEGKKRLSGEDAFAHCYEIGKILVELKLDSHTIAAGLLHDVLDFGVKLETIAKEFDQELFDLVKSVSKLETIGSKLSFEEEEARRAENLRKIILATAKDVRVILIKLADRLHNMRTLKYLSSDKKIIISKETLEIYAPIAHKLGMYNLKGELEDWAFRFLEPSTYQDIKKRIHSKRDQREKEVVRIADFVKLEIKKSGIEAEIEGRAKHFFSIYKKIVQKNKKFDEIYDLIAIRIITESVNDCYSALGIIHKLWKPIPERFKDYIAIPKSNGYQSLHTDVVLGEGKILEVQIRNRSMHLAAEQGIASHWKYKGEEKDKRFDRQIEWLKQFLEWKRTIGAKDFIESLKMDLFQKEMFVFTPKGDPIILPEGSTPVDFAYAVHSNIGDHCKQAKVNGAIVTLDSSLSPGDIIEIITVKNISVSRSWLSFVKSMHTKIKIKHALKIPPDRRGRKKDADSENLETSEIKEIFYEGKMHHAKIPRCCKPQSEDAIIGFKTKDGKIVVHKKSCVNIHSYNLSKSLDIKFADSEKKTIPVKIDVHDRIGVLADILTLLATQNGRVKSVNTKFACF